MINNKIRIFLRVCVSAGLLLLQIWEKHNYHVSIDWPKALVLL